MVDLLDNNTPITSQIEKICKKYFGVDLLIENIILDDAPTSKNSITTVFKTNHDTIYALCTADDPLVLADVKNIVKSMGMKADVYLPPNADQDYFLRFGHKMFQDVFPNRKTRTNQETSFYQTLAPYSPALVRIAKVDGEIRQYSKIGEKWYSALEFSYQRMQVQ